MQMFLLINQIKLFNRGQYLHRVEDIFKKLCNVIIVFYLI